MRFLTQLLFLLWIVICFPKLIHIPAVTDRHYLCELPCPYILKTYYLFPHQQHCNFSMCCEHSYP